MGTRSRWSQLRRTSAINIAPQAGANLVHGSADFGLRTELKLALDFRVVHGADRKFRVLVLVGLFGLVSQTLALLFAAQTNQRFLFFFFTSNKPEMVEYVSYSRKFVTSLRLHRDHVTSIVSASNMGVIMCSLFPIRPLQPILSVSWYIPKLQIHEISSVLESKRFFFRDIFCSPLQIRS